MGQLFFVLFIFKVECDFEKVYDRRDQSVLTVCVSLASDSSETINNTVIIIKLGMVTASDILTLTLVQKVTQIKIMK